MQDKVLIISFSGGRTSAYMTRMLLQQKEQWKDVVVLFANTGQEDERTLKFVHDCDVFFDFNTVWLEAKVTQEKGIGTKHTITDYSNASRDGSPFEAVIQKYGIPFTKMPHCTRELKLAPINSYIKDLGLSKKDYRMAIGIRADEFDRVSSSAAENSLFYPLVEEGVTKPQILEWWKGQPFDLTVPEHFGNCVWCWKKSFKKLLTVMSERPDAFDFPERMEKLYGQSGVMASKMGKDIKFFRGFKSVEDLREMANLDFEHFVDQHYLNISNGCSESCEVFSDDQLQLNLNLEEV